MRVNLNQAEIFQAITNFVRSKWKLEDATTVEISLTAGRSPKGYTADVEITYPEEAPGNVTTRVVEDDTTDAADSEAAAESPSDPVVVEQVSPAAAGAASSANLFDN